MSHSLNEKVKLMERFCLKNVDFEAASTSKCYTMQNSQSEKGWDELQKTNLNSFVKHSEHYNGGLALTRRSIRRTHGLIFGLSLIAQSV
jgi:hypothetical protein